MSAELAMAAAAAAVWVAVAVPPRRRVLRSGRSSVAGARQWLQRRRVERTLAADAPRLWWDTATELRSGAPLGAALRSAVSEASLSTQAVLAPTVAASALGLPLPDRLRAVPEESFTWAAAAVDLAAQDGAGLAEALHRVGEIAAEDRSHRQEQRALLAGARATSRILLGLPVIGVLLGWGFGADPLAFLLGTAAGRLCLVGAIVLDIAGWWWIRALTRL